MWPSRSVENIAWIILISASPKPQHQAHRGLCGLKGFAGERSQECVHWRFHLLQAPTDDPSFLVGVTPCPQGVLDGKLVSFLMSDANPVCRRKILITRAGRVSPVSSLPSLQELHAAEVRRNKEQREEISG